MKKLNLGTDKIGKLLFTFSIPCVISMLVNSIYNIVDQIFIGQGVGYLGNGATNVIFPLVTISTALALLIGDGAASFLSLNLGEKDYKEAKKGLGSALTFLVVLAVLLFLGIIVFLPNLVDLLGCTKEIRPYALSYGKIIAIGLPFMMIYTALNSIIRADGSPRYSMISMVSGALLNIILDAIFVLVFKMGVGGAAIATVIGQFLSFIISVLYLRKFKSIHLEKKDFRFTKKIIKVCGYGISSFITQMTIVVVIVVLNNLLGKYGVTSKYGANIPISVFGIVMKVNQIFISIIVGIAVGAQPIVGFNYGAKNYARVKKTFLTVIKTCFTVGVIGMLFFQLFPQNIITIFGNESGLYNEFAIKCFRIFLMCTALNAFQISSSIFFQSLGKPVKSALCSLSRQILFLIPAAFILSSIFGIDGILYAAPVADGLAFIVTVSLFIHEYRHLSQNRENVDL